ncbi:MAG: rhombosortase [Steroidobacteraceae bacterium]
MNAAPPVTGFAGILKSLNGDGRYGVTLLVLAALLLLPELGGETVRLTLRYDRAGLESFQIYRLLTAHIVHLDLEHAVLNALGLVLMWALFARDFSPGRWLLIWLAASLTVSAGLWWLSPQIDWYVGASGALHGVLAAGTLAHLRRRDLDGWILAAFLVAKLSYEQWQGAMPFEASGLTLSIAHLYGALGGLAAALLVRSRREPL